MNLKAVILQFRPQPQRLNIPPQRILGMEISLSILVMQKSRTMSEPTERGTILVQTSLWQRVLNIKLAIQEAGALSWSIRMKT